MQWGRLLGLLLSSLSLCACRPAPPTPPVAQPATAPETAAQKLEVEQSDGQQISRVEITDRTLELKSGLSILFETGSEKMLPASFSILDEIAAVLKVNDTLRVRIEGHTDKVGSAEANLELSKKRAAAVRAYLVSQGVDEKRLSSVGCGSDYPITENSSEEGRAQNRRVEFVILEGVVNVCRIYKRERMGN